jgi:heptosyltransferase-3
LTRGKILVIRGGAIGDFILTLPVLAALREQFPQTHVEVLGYPHIAQLALTGGLADQVQSIEARALAGFFAARSELDEKLAEYFAAFHIIISYLYDPDEIFQTNVARCSKAQFIAGPHRPDESARRHATEVFLKPLERLAIFHPDPIPRLNLGTEEAARFSFAREVHERKIHAAAPWLALHPGSGSEKKNWPESRWAELLEHLVAATDFNLLLIGGEAEGERLGRLAAPVSPNRLKLAKSLPLAELAGWIKQCLAYIGHDSGISHLAAAVGLNGLILWGDTNLEVWRPPSPCMNILREPGGLAELSVQRVIEEFTRI